MRSWTVAELKSRVKAHGAELPIFFEKADLQAFVDELEAKQRDETACVLARHAVPARELRIPELKSRMVELGLEVPSFALEKQELVELLEEAEKALQEEFCIPSLLKSTRNTPYVSDAITGQTTWNSQAVRDDSLNALVEIGPIGLSDPVPGKHDYRDDAFADGIKDQSIDAAWSREDILECSFGSEGVNARSVSPALSRSMSIATIGHRISKKAVAGASFTWVRGETIGRGAFGCVFKALDQHTGRILAVKEVLINPVSEEDNRFRVELENEVAILSTLSHMHIVSYLGHDYVGECLYLYLEYVSGGTVTQALQQFGAFEESLMADYSKQVLSGLEYLHTRSPPVIHRDIKGSNILLGLDGKAKLADFGCSRKAAQTLTHTMRGSIPWMAPEVIAHSRHGRAGDVWSFGCFVIEMGTAAVPWGCFDNQMAALVKIGLSKQLPALPCNISETCQEFILKCVQREVENRPSATELLQHPLIKDI
mmetsp:Transcript_9385/g.15140  ORF Transcript_9385/g.15140 Transcript_9385/m.15140 type:complete len:483 (-) Transcript_9385:107-1555(-)